MKKILIILGVLLIVCAAVLGGMHKYKKDHLRFKRPDVTVLKDFGGLDHDIYVYGVTKICDEQLKGFDTTVGPTGWPWTDPVMWEVALFEDNTCYYARLIFHEYMLWWSFDDPYIVCKIPKENVGGDLRTNEKLRWQVLWNITDTTYKSYNYNPYMKGAVIKKINGHTVAFGNYACKYEKYFVISDMNYPW